MTVDITAHGVEDMNTTKHQMKEEQALRVLSERQLQTKKGHKVRSRGKVQNKVKRTKSIEDSFKHGIPTGLERRAAIFFFLPICTVSLLQSTQVSIWQTFSEYLLCARLEPSMGEGKERKGLNVDVHLTT